MICSVLNNTWQDTSLAAYLIMCRCALAAHAQRQASLLFKWDPLSSTYRRKILVRYNQEYEGEAWTIPQWLPGEQEVALLRFIIERRCRLLVYYLHIKAHSGEP